MAERSKVPSRQTITEQEYRLRCYVRPDNLAGVCVTDQEYEDRVSFTMLSKILDEFSLAVPASLWPTLDEKKCNFNRLPELLAKWQNPREADALMRVQVTVVLNSTFQFGEFRMKLKRLRLSCTTLCNQYWTVAKGERKFPF